MRCPAYCLLLLLASPLTAQEEQSPFDRYFELTATFPNSLKESGSWKDGEIEILYSPAEMKRAEQAIYDLHIAKGYSAKEADQYSQVGVLTEDSYYYFIRDAVVFPSGKYGTYDRIIQKNGITGPGGVCVCAVLPNKKIVTILSYRHALRGWTLELPRGGRELQESPEAAASRELSEETGYVGEEMTLLGRMSTDSGIIAQSNPIYFARASFQTDGNPDYSEAISCVKTFTIKELKQAIGKGEMNIEINGIMRRVQVIDSYLSHALLLAEARGLL